MAQFQRDGDPDLDKMFFEAQRFAASLNFTAPYCLTLAGKTGTGKTHLAKKVLRQFTDQNRFEVKYDALDQRILGNTSMWVDWRKLCIDARTQGCDHYRLVDDICREWFVVIDDLGAGRDNTGFVTDIADQIISGRKEKWTLITTNLSLRELADKMDVRIADRLLRNNGVVVEVNAKSFALK